MDSVAYVSAQGFTVFWRNIIWLHAENPWVGYGGQNGNSMVGSDSGGATFGAARRAVITDQPPRIHETNNSTGSSAIMDPTNWWERYIPRWLNLP
jgi:hypothetical protein